MSGASLFWDLLVYTIYLIEDHRNKPYVGITSKTPEDRLQEHKVSARCGGDTHLHNAMRKYGCDEFEIIPLVTTSSKEEAYELEEEWIERLGTFKDWGYNMTPGGDRGPRMEGEDHPMYGRKLPDEQVRKMAETRKGREFSEEHKQSLSESKSGGNNPMYGEQLSKQHKQRIREALLGREFSEEWRRKISEAHRGEDANGSKLTADEAAEVKYLAREGDLTQREIADRYGLASVASVSNVKNEKQWAHIEPKAPAQH